MRGLKGEFLITGRMEMLFTEMGRFREKSVLQMELESGLQFWTS